PVVVAVLPAVRLARGGAVAGAFLHLGRGRRGDDDQRKRGQNDGQAQAQRDRARRCGPSAGVCVACRVCGDGGARRRRGRRARVRSSGRGRRHGSPPMVSNPRESGCAAPPEAIACPHVGADTATRTRSVMDRIRLVILACAPVTGNRPLEWTSVATRDEMCVDPATHHGDTSVKSTLPTYGNRSARAVVTPIARPVDPGGSGANLK